jgi:hypothetical protein
MSLDDWLKQNQELGAYSNRQPLEPFPNFQHRCVSAGWEHIERYSLHQLRRGLPVAARLHWFRAIDEGWEEPTGMIHVIVPDPERHPDVSIFQLGYSSDPAARCAGLEADSSYRLTVFQQWPGSRSLARSLAAALSSTTLGGGWNRWIPEDVMQLTTAMDVVANAWAHRRYWFGLAQ